MPYTCYRAEDGNHDSYEIADPEGERFANIYYEGCDTVSHDRAEGRAKLITDALNAFSPSNTAA